jgi:diguanylate cyclase (GGDEF)-like protein
VVSHITLNNLVAANHLVAESEQTIKLLSDLHSAMADAESDQRGFIITGEKRYLEPFMNSRPIVATKLKEIARRTTDDVEEKSRLVMLGTLIEKRFELLDNMNSAHKKQGLAAAIALNQSDQGNVIMDRIQRTIDEIQGREEVRLAARATDSEHNVYITKVTNGVAAFINVCLLGGICFMVIRDTVARKKSAALEREFNEKVAHSLAEVQVRNQEITFLGQLSSFLQTCTTSQEACTAIARFGPQLFPTEAGVIYLFHASRNFVEQVASWGSVELHEDMFQPVDCWALRRGRLHAVGATDTTMVCNHVARRGEPVQPYVCAPMMAQGETLGLLFLQAHPVAGGTAALSDAKQQLAAAVAEQIALALSNLILRETLRQQSVRDPLTKLYNRRFLEETLDRELARLERKNLPLSLIMIDVDHFKSFNDTFGHEIGDAVLRDLSEILQRNVRGSDIACRYGGEEFIIVLPEANVEIARQRAETLREAMRELQLVHDGKPLGPVTLSLGVACFPEHGHQREQLLQAADAALYEAKNAGRNRVVVSTIKTQKAVEIPQQRDQAGH